LNTVLHKEYRARKTWRGLRNGGFWILDFGFWRRSTQSKIQNPKSKIQKAASMLYNFTTLPIGRRKLDKLARLSKRGIGPLPRIMKPEAAATPTSQVE